MFCIEFSMDFWWVGGSDGSWSDFLFIWRVLST